MARDNAYIYALDYVDRFLGINIIDINYALYFEMIYGHEVNDPRFELNIYVLNSIICIIMH
jgi:hypothetical protein